MDTQHHTGSIGSNVVPFTRPQRAPKPHSRNVVTGLWRGAGMPGVIEPGDIIEADLGIHEIRGDGVYLVDLDGALELRRIQNLPDGRLRVGVDGQHFDMLEVCAISVAGIVTTVWRRA